MGRDSKDVDVAGAGFDDNRQYSRWSVTAQSTWKKSAASMVAACACRPCRQVVSVCRLGAGGILSAPRTRRIVEALTR
jgi:hypothetical protein